MSFRHVAALLAEGLSLDQFTGRMSVFNMMEIVFAPSFPAALAKLVVINLYEIDGERDARWERVSVIDAAGQLLGEALVELTGEGEAHRSASMFQGLRLMAPGVVTIRVEGAEKKDGPWQAVCTRRLRAELGVHPLVRFDEKNKAAGKIAGPVALTE